MSFLICVFTYKASGAGSPKLPLSPHAMKVEAEQEEEEQDGKKAIRLERESERDGGGAGSARIERAVRERATEGAPKSPLTSNKEEHGREASSQHQALA